MRLTGCEVCWKCRGLIPGYPKNSALEDHIASCESYVCNETIFNFFVCDKLDYLALKKLKENIDIDHQSPLLESLSKILPEEAVKAIIDICLFQKSFRSPKKHQQELSCASFADNKGEIKSTDDSENKKGGQRHKRKSEQYAEPVCSRNIKRLALKKDTLGLSPNFKALILPKSVSKSMTKVGKIYSLNDLSANSLVQVTSMQNLHPKKIFLATDISSSVKANKKSIISTKSKAEQNTPTPKPDVLSQVQKEKLSSECVVHVDGNDTIYSCKLCNEKQCASESEMLRHLKCHNNGMLFSCSNCQYSTMWRQEWSSHKDKCSNSNSLLCQVCGEAFSGKVSLRKHFTAMHGIAKMTEFKCKDCDYISVTLTSLKEHEKKHTGELWSCPNEDCSFESIYKRALTKHLTEKHAKEKTFVCSVCGLQTRHKSSLFKHMQIHQNDKKFKCVKCPYSAISSYQVQAHVRKKHLKEKLFFCPNCPFTTGYSMGIINHLQKHLGTKCSICGEHFGDVKSAKLHIAQFHNNLDKQTWGKKETSKIVQKVHIENLKPGYFRIGKKEANKETILKYITTVSNTKALSYSYSEVNKTSVTNNQKENSLETPVIQEALSIDRIQRNISINTIIPNPIKTSLLSRQPNCIRNIIQTATHSKTNQVLAPQTKLGNLLNEAPNSSEILEMATDIISRDEQQRSIISDDLMQSSVNSGTVPLDQVQELLENQVSSHKERNPMLSATSKDLGDTDNSLIDDSLFDLMSDFPRPTNSNRCQSASTLMFTSFSPHLVDRPLTPDFFTDSPSAGSFFPNFTSKPLDSDPLPIANLSSYDTPQETPARQLLKASNAASPICGNFLHSPMANITSSLPIVNMSEALMQSSNCESSASDMPTSVFGVRCLPEKVLSGQMAFSTRRSMSAFTPLTDQYSRDLQNAVDSITNHDASISEESPFPLI